MCLVPFRVAVSNQDGDWEEDVEPELEDLEVGWSDAHSSSRRVSSASCYRTPEQVGALNFRSYDVRI